MKQSSMNSPVMLVVAMIALTGIVAYHALDSWYIQTANARRLRADYSALAAARFNDLAAQALAKGTADSVAFADIFAHAKLLPAGIPAGRDNASALIIEVLSPDDRVVFQSGRHQKDAYVATDTLRGQNRNYITRVAARRGSSAWLATEGLASRMTMILWLLVACVIISVITARLMRKEVSLAQARTNFVASVSHELRTPLSQIQAYLETLRLGRFNTEDEKDWLMSGMQREITRLTALVDNVLTVANSERGVAKPVMQHQPIHVAPVLDSIVNDFSLLAAARSTRIDTAFAPGTFVAISPDRLRQLVLNVLDNSLKYGPAGQTISMSLEQRGASCVLTIDDQGPGIPVADRERIWKRFERGAMKDAAIAGSGIGLAVVRDIVTAARGRYTIADSPSGGARFIFEFPNEHDTSS